MNQYNNFKIIIIKIKILNLILYLLFKTYFENMNKFLTKKSDL